MDSSPSGYLGPALVLAITFHIVMLFGFGPNPAPTPSPKAHPRPVEFIFLQEETVVSAPQPAKIEQLKSKAIAAPTPPKLPVKLKKTPPPRPHANKIPRTKKSTQIKKQRSQLPPAKPAPTPPPIATTPKLSGAQLIARGLQLARHHEEITNRPSATSHQRFKQISSATRDLLYRSYMDAWRRKIERFGKLNYPEEAKRKGLHGQLRLEVRLAPNGALLEIRLLKSSGHPLLDKAAQRIVTLAAPFAPFPPAMRTEIDELHLVRNWQFKKTNQIVAP